MTYVDILKHEAAKPIDFCSVIFPVSGFIKDPSSVNQSTRDFDVCALMWVIKFGGALGTGLETSMGASGQFAHWTRTCAFVQNRVLPAPHIAHHLPCPRAFLSVTVNPLAVGVFPINLKLFWGMFLREYCRIPTNNHFLLH